MNIQRFILPATIAAAFHAALFWALPVEPYTRLVQIVLKPAPPPPPPPDDNVPQATEDKTPAAEPIKPLRGGSPAPDIPDGPVIPKPDRITIPVDERPQTRVATGRLIPPSIGPGETGGPAVSGPVIFRPVDLDRVPSAKVQLPPDYPSSLKQAGVTGAVTVEFDVDRSGQVVSARVLDSTNGEFEAPTLRAVLKWRFEPGRRNGRAVPFRLQVPVHFQLD